MEAHAIWESDAYSASMNKFAHLIQQIDGLNTEEMSLSQIEVLIEVEGRELLRTLMEERIHRFGSGNIGKTIETADRSILTATRERIIGVKTLFGEIKVERTIYSKQGHESLAPKAAILNFPQQSYSHNLEKRLSFDAARGSFDEAINTVELYTGATIPKRQAEEIAVRSSFDFESFYAQRSVEVATDSIDQKRLIVLSTDGKGVVIRKEDLRPETKKRAEKEKKLKKRLSKGEKKNAKRMAQIASVYTIDPYVRSAEEILSGISTTSPPKPINKRVWASLELDQADVIKRMFKEAESRDPDHKNPWVFLVDGQLSQLNRIRKEMKVRGISGTIIVDIIHVIEYLWKASREFYSEGSTEGEEWVSRYLLMILQSKAKRVASAIRRSATRQNKTDRANIDTCASYLHKYARYMDYNKYLTQGLPIATGVIEGACRYLVKDRMDITGARWSLKGAEAILRLRSIRASGDWEEYWKYHEKQELMRNHLSRYANPEVLQFPKLTQVK